MIELKAMSLLEVIDYVKNSQGREVRLGGLIETGKDWKDAKDLLVMIKKKTLPEGVKIFSEDEVEKYTNNITVKGLIGERICAGWYISVKKYSHGNEVWIRFNIN